MDILDRLKGHGEDQHDLDGEYTSLCIDLDCAIDEIERLRNELEAKNKKIDTLAALRLENNELRKQVEAMQWRDIESAPTDCVRVLLTGKCGPTTGHYDGFWHMHSWLNQDEQPSHYMPLPPTPEE